MKDLWNKRYSETDFVYGTEPNEFLKKYLNDLTPGKALFIAEGEGRNAVYAASLGWETDAMDWSEEGKKKAEKLADEKNVKINYIVQDIGKYDFPNDCYDLIVFVFVHLPYDLKREIHKKSIPSLKKGGSILIEVFEKDQLNYSSGGPKTEDLLFSLSEIAEDFIDLEFEYFAKEEIELNEGLLHIGKGMVIRFIGKKDS